MTCTRCGRTHRSVAWSDEFAVTVCDQCWRIVALAAEEDRRTAANRRYGREVDAIHTARRNLSRATWLRT